MSNTFQCKVGVDLWKHETDHVYCISPTGKKVSFYYHAQVNGVHWTHKTTGIYKLVAEVFQLWTHAPLEGEYNSSTDWQRIKTLMLTKEQMAAFLEMSKLHPYKR